MKLLLIILICYCSASIEVSYAQYRIDIFTTEVTSSQTSSIYSSNSEYKLVGGAGQSAVSSSSGYFRSLQGSGFLTHVDFVDPILPNSFVLYQNYPNPFNPSTVIKYQLPLSGNVTLKVYDLLGREVATLVDEFKPAGSYEVEFDASSNSGSVRNLTSGIYFYKLQSENFNETKKMMLLK
ncbi:MAG: T9SS type A sorting domain-containing protein [bacterium]|nr:T9SS type A sorting domain-containing protein [bacterium]